MKQKITETYELRDIPDVSPLLPSMHIPWWLVALLLIILLSSIWLIRKILLRKKQSPENMRAEALLQAHKEITAVSETSSASQKATALSLALRGYLSKALGDPSLYQTHEEFISAQHSLERIPVQQKNSMQEFFMHLARLKYAPHSTEPDTSTLISDTKNMLENLHRAII